MINKIDENILNLDFACEGRIKLVASKVDSEGNIISSRIAADWFHNIITNGGLDSLGAGTSPYAFVTGCSVGTGNTPETAADTTLQAFLAGTNTISVSPANTAQVSTQPWYVAHKVTYRFNTGVAAGNISEVGMAINTSGAPNSASNLFSRALIRDSGGIPTTITILSDEILDVYYEFRLYPPNAGSDITGTFSWTINGTPTTYNYTLRPCGMSSIALGFGGIYWPVALVSNSTFFYATTNVGGVTNSVMNSPTTNTGPTGIAGWGSVGNSTYVSGNYYKDLTYNLGLANGNLAIQTLVTQIGVSTYQWQISPTLTKDNTRTFTWTIRVSWSRYTP